MINTNSNTKTNNNSNSSSRCDDGNAQSGPFVPAAMMVIREREKVDRTTEAEMDRHTSPIHCLSFCPHCHQQSQQQLSSASLSSSLSSSSLIAYCSYCNSSTNNMEASLKTIDPSTRTQTQTLMMDSSSWMEKPSLSSPSMDVVIASKDDVNTCKDMLKHQQHQHHQRHHSCDNNNNNSIYCTIADSPGSRRKRARKSSVHFTMHDTIIHPSQSFALDPNHGFHQLWWTDAETEENYRKAKDHASKYRAKHTEDAKAFSKLFSRCANTKSKRASSFGPADVELLLRQQSCRGLERTVHPILSFHRSKYVKTMVRLQSKLSTNKLTLEQKNRLICTKSQQLSRPSRSLASILAYHDSIQVAELVREELLLAAQKQLQMEDEEEEELLHDHIKPHNNNDNSLSTLSTLSMDEDDADDM